MPSVSIEITLECLVEMPQDGLRKDKLQIYNGQYNISKAVHPVGEGIGSYW